MEIGMAPFKSLLQTGFMMWMSGNSINIFSIMITAMIVMNTTKSLFNLTSGTLLYCRAITVFDRPGDSLFVVFQFLCSTSFCLGE